MALLDYRFDTFGSTEWHPRLLAHLRGSENCVCVVLPPEWDFATGIQWALPQYEGRALVVTETAHQASRYPEPVCTIQSLPRDLSGFDVVIGDLVTIGALMKLTHEIAHLSHLVRLVCKMPCKIQATTARRLSQQQVPSVRVCERIEGIIRCDLATFHRLLLVRGFGASHVTDEGGALVFQFQHTERVDTERVDTEERVWPEWAFGSQENPGARLLRRLQIPHYMLVDIDSHDVSFWINSAVFFDANQRVLTEEFDLAGAFERMQID